MNVGKMMSVSIDTWAVILATAMGPVAAVLITLWYGAVSSKYSRRLQVFRTLMATRRVGISPDHVNALNLIEVDFYKCGKVELAWKEYKNHLSSSSLNEEIWAKQKEKLLANLLFQMAGKLRFKIPALDIFEGGYSPQGWQFKESRQNEVTEYVYDLSMAKKAVPIWVMGMNPPSNADSNISQEQNEASETK